MTTGAARTGAMQRQALADGLRRSCLVICKIGVHARRRRRDGQSQNVVQKKFPAQDGRRAIWIRRCNQQRALRKQSSALFGVWQSDATETAAVNSWNPVMPRQTLIDERVVGVQEVIDASVLA